MSGKSYQCPNRHCNKSYVHSSSLRNHRKVCPYGKNTRVQFVKAPMTRSQSVNSDISEVEVYYPQVQTTGNKRKVPVPPVERTPSEQYQDELRAFEIRTQILDIYKGLKHQEQVAMKQVMGICEDVNDNLSEHEVKSEMNKKKKLIRKIEIEVLFYEYGLLYRKTKEAMKEGELRRVRQRQDVEKKRKEEFEEDEDGVDTEYLLKTTKNTPVKESKEKTSLFAGLSKFIFE